MKKNAWKTTRQYGGVDADQRHKDRKEKFITAGLEAFGTLGYAKATIKGICQHAGLTERYFYESFQSKEDLLCIVFRQLSDQLTTDAQKIIETPGISQREAAYRALKNFYLNFKNDPRRARVQLFEILGVSPRVDEEYQASMHELANWVELIWAFLFPKSDCEWLKKTIIPIGASGGIVFVAHQWVLDDFSIPVDDIVSQTIEMFMIIGQHYQDIEKNQANWPEFENDNIERPLFS